MTAAEIDLLPPGLDLDTRVATLLGLPLAAYSVDWAAMGQLIQRLDTWFSDFSSIYEITVEDAWHNVAGQGRWFSSIVGPGQRFEIVTRGLTAPHAVAKVALKAALDPRLAGRILITPSVGEENG